MPTATADPSIDGGNERAATRSLDRLRRASRRCVPSASTTAFRIAFGLLIVGSTIRFVARGWVDLLYLAPTNHLTYAGFDWVRPLPPVAMYAHMAALAALGVAITVGYHTRLASALFALGFAYVELIDAALYLNHYWFVTLAAIVLAVAPAASNGTVPAIAVWALRSQIAVVYVFAGIAKLNPDWLVRAQPMSIWLAARTDRPLLGPWLDEPLVAFALSWAGAVFDLTIVGWLLWKRTRPIAYLIVVVFHVATALLFQIGVFPWVMIALTPVFFAPDWPVTVRRRLAGTRTRPDAGSGVPGASGGRPIDRPASVAMAILLAINVMLPLRHYAADGNVRFNDDGYYLSWRVMLTERAGFLEFDVRDRSSGTSWTVRPDLVLTEWQATQASDRPDLALATAHLVKAHYETRSVDVAVYANAWVAFNGHPRQRWIDPELDLTTVPRNAAASTYVLALDPTPEQ